jgi:hypothetical protein
MSLGRKSGLFGLCLGLLATTGCLMADKDACGKGSNLVNKVCIDDLPEEEEEDAAVAEPDAATADAGANAFEGLGDGCKKDVDCKATAPYCALQPNKPGYCTIPGCEVDNAAALCPDTWTCYDLAVFGGPTICRKPD